MHDIDKQIIREAVSSVYSDVIINQFAGLSKDELKQVCAALDILRNAIGDKTAYEVKYGTKPQFEVTVKNFEGK